jgi:hypothetical protein
MRTVLSKDGTPIAFDQSGEGPPIILVVGAFNDRSTAAPLAAQPPVLSLPSRRQPPASPSPGSRCTIHRSCSTTGFRNGPGRSRRGSPN